jgi:outer membrane protein assembly factor BamB
MTKLENRSRPPYRVRRLGALAIATAALLGGGVSFVGADPAPAGPASPATAANLAPKWTSHFGSGKYQASPVVAGNFVYVGDEDGFLTKLPLATGTASQPGTFTPTWTTNVCFNSIFSKPVVANGRVFVATAAGYVCAFDDNTGTFLWRQWMGVGQWANGPVLVGDTLYATGSNGTVAAFDAFSGTGAPRWRVNIGSDSQHPWFTGPTVLNGTVYVGTVDGRIMAVTPPATAGAPATVTQLGPKFDGQINDAVATDGTNLYASVDKPTSPSVGTVNVVSLTQQGAVRWNFPTGLDPTYNGRIAGPAVVNGIVYAPTKFGIVLLRDNGTRVAVADTSPNQPTTPTIANGVAYAGGIQGSGAPTGALQAFDAATGVRLYYAHTPTVAHTTPAVAPDGTVLLGGGNGSQGAGVLWAYAPATPQQNS